MTDLIAIAVMAIGMLIGYAYGYHDGVTRRERL